MAGHLWPLRSLSRFRRLDYLQRSSSSCPDSSWRNILVHRNLNRTWVPASTRTLHMPTRAENSPSSPVAYGPSKPSTCLGSSCCFFQNGCPPEQMTCDLTVLKVRVVCLKGSSFPFWVGSIHPQKRLWCWEGLRAGEGSDRGCDGWMASPNQWAWV